MELIWPKIEKGFYTCSAIVFFSLTQINIVVGLNNCHVSSGKNGVFFKEALTGADIVEGRIVLIIYEGKRKRN